MKRLTRFFAATLLALPLVATAQTANTPGGQASTGSALDQTTGDPQKATPKTTSTSPDTTNPSGQTTHHAKHRAKPATTEAGDAPTYPAPAPDGTPTK